MHRSEVTVDLGAVRRNARTLLRALEGSQLWAVVKANAYGHGAIDVAGAVVDEGAGALCVATVAEGLELRQEFSLIRILVMGPTASSREVAEAREAKLELAVWDEELPEGVRVHLKLDTGMGRWGLSELPALYGLSPFGEDPAVDGLEPALSWHSYLAQVKLLRPGESAGYGRRFVAERPTWIGLVPVGYGDGFRRDLTGTEVRIGGELRPVVGTVSM